MKCVSFIICLDSLFNAKSRSPAFPPSWVPCQGPCHPQRFSMHGNFSLMCLAVVHIYFSVFLGITLVITLNSFI